MVERSSQYIPRWLHFKANVSADLTSYIFTEIPQNVFANETIWPYHLEYLAISGAVPGVPTGGGTGGGFFGGVGNNINLELGISGTSDINQVTATATTVMGMSKRDVLCPPMGFGTSTPYYDGPLTLKLKYPYLLARGNGFNVEFRNSMDDYGALSLLGGGVTTYDSIPAFAAYGRTLNGDNPVMLAGSFRTTDNPNTLLGLLAGNGVSFSKADLVNNGSDDVLIDTLCFTHNIGAQLDPGLSSFGVAPPLFSEYLVNPINGIKWMPGSDVIPIMNICPAAFPWPVEWGTQASPSFPVIYEFPDSTVLHRRQRLSVRMFNRCFYPDPPNPTVSLPIRVNVSLFGYLEVR